jgi:hypothetical protein
MELSTDELKSLQVPEPPPQQQRSIADYLDREAARIDALIDAKERVLELLARSGAPSSPAPSPAASTPTPRSATRASHGSVRFRRIGS